MYKHNTVILGYHGLNSLLSLLSMGNKYIYTFLIQTREEIVEIAAMAICLKTCISKQQSLLEVR